SIVFLNGIQFGCEVCHLLRMELVDGLITGNLLGVVAVVRVGAGKRGGNPRTEEAEITLRELIGKHEGGDARGIGPERQSEQIHHLPGMFPAVGGNSGWWRNEFARPSGWSPRLLGSQDRCLHAPLDGPDAVQVLRDFLLIKRTGALLKRGSVFQNDLIEDASLPGGALFGFGSAAAEQHV